MCTCFAVLVKEQTGTFLVKSCVTFRARSHRVHTSPSGAFFGPDQNTACLVWFGAIFFTSTHKSPRTWHQNPRVCKEGSMIGPNRLGAGPKSLSGQSLAATFEVFDATLILWPDVLQRWRRLARSYEAKQRLRLTLAWRSNDGTTKLSTMLTRTIFPMWLRKPVRCGDFRTPV